MTSSGTGRKGQRPGSGGERRGWPTREILRTLAIIAGFYITLQLLWVGRSVVLLTFLGVLFGIALTAGVDWLERRRVPRGVGAVLIVLAFGGILFGIGASTAPSITSQLRELKTQLPEAIIKIQRWVRERQEGVTQVLQQVAPETVGADSAGMHHGGRAEEGKPMAAAERSDTGSSPRPLRCSGAFSSSLSWRSSSL